MSEKTESIDVDSATASVLKTPAAEHGVSVSDLVAELVPPAIDDSALVELDRPWAAIERGQATVPHAEIERGLCTWGSTDFGPWSER